MTQVRTGNKVAINGERGIVTEVTNGQDGRVYAKIHFEGNIGTYGQYQDRFYRDTDFTVIG